MKNIIAVGGIAALSLAALSGSALAGSETAVTTPSVTAPSVTVVAKKLNNPRELTFGPDGALYVAESGSGGTIKCVTPPAPPGAKAEKSCLGLTGKIIKIKDGVKSTVLSGLPSVGGHGAGTGPHDMAFTADGDLLVAMGLGGGPGLRDGRGAT